MCCSGLFLCHDAVWQIVVPDRADFQQTGIEGRVAHFLFVDTFKSQEILLAIFLIDNISIYV